MRQTPNGTWGTPINRTKLAAASYFTSWPTWSPDGHWIAYSNAFLGGSLFTINPDSGAHRTVLDPAKSGMNAEYPVWSADSRTLYFKSHDAKGNAEFWSIPINGGAPTLLAHFDDPDRPAYRPEWSIGDGRMYFTIADFQSDVWVMQTSPQ